MTLDKDGNGTLYLYGAISEWEVNAKDLNRTLQSSGIEKGAGLEIHIHSPGGDVFEGVTIMSLLSEYATIAVVDGLAASAASVIAMSCDKVEMREGSQMMIHNPWSIAIGESKEMRKTADLLDSIRDQMVGVYKRRLGDDEDKIKSMLDDETWLTPDEAIEIGACDAKREKQLVAAMLPNVCKLDASKSRYLYQPEADEYDQRISAELTSSYDQLAKNAQEIARLTEERNELQKSLDAESANKQDLEASIAETDTALQAARKEVADLKEHRDIAVRAAESRHQPVDTTEDGRKNAPTFANAYEEYKSIEDGEKRREFFRTHQNEIFKHQPKG